MQPSPQQNSPIIVTNENDDDKSNCYSLTPNSRNGSISGDCIELQIPSPSAYLKSGSSSSLHVPPLELSAPSLKKDMKNSTEKIINMVTASEDQEKETDDDGEQTCLLQSKHKLIGHEDQLNRQSIMSQSDQLNKCSDGQPSAAILKSIKYNGTILNSIL